MNKVAYKLLRVRKDGTDRIAALAILDIINHRLHKKYRLSITENHAF